MGIWEQMPDAFLDNLQKTFGFDPPRAHGHDIVKTIQAMLDDELDVFVGMGGNALSAAPDTERTAIAMKKCKLTVQIATKLNRGHIVTGEEALLLPCLGRTEQDRQRSGPQFVTVENSMSVISKSQGHLEPASAYLKSECAIVAGMAKATLGEMTTVDWDAMIADYDNIRAKVEDVVNGFHDYNVRVRQPGGFYLGNSVRDRRFETKSGKAHFHVTEIAKHDLSGGRLLMTTIRSHDQYNTTVYALDDRYRGIENGRRIVFMNGRRHEGPQADGRHGGRHHEPQQRRHRAHRESLVRGSVSDPTRQRGDVLPGGQRPRLARERREALGSAGVEIGRRQRRALEGVKVRGIRGFSCRSIRGRQRGALRA